MKIVDHKIIQQPPTLDFNILWQMKKSSIALTQILLIVVQCFLASPPISWLCFFLLYHSGMYTMK